jgi:hypothetical protein
MTVGDKSAKERIKDVNEFTKKNSKAKKCIRIYDRVSKYSFLSGIVFFLFAIIFFKL